MMMKVLKNITLDGFVLGYENGVDSKLLNSIKHGLIVLNDDKELKVQMNQEVFFFDHKNTTWKDTK